MIGTYELIVMMISVILALVIMGVCIWTKSLFRYGLLNLYLLANVVFTAAGYYIYTTYGYNSSHYFYYYYTGDPILNIALYLLVGSFFDRMLRDSTFHKYVRPTLAIFFLLVVVVSGVFISGSVDRMRVFPRFVIQFQQNMYFVGVLLTFLLWISMSYLRAESRRFVLLVSGLGIYFSAHAANYALRFFFRASNDAAVTAVLGQVPPLAYCLMVLLWLYTFLRVPEGEPMVARAGPQAAPVKVKISSE